MMPEIYPGRTTFSKPDRVLAVMYFLGGGDERRSVPKMDVVDEVMRERLFDISDEEFRDYIERKRKEPTVLDAQILIDN